MKALMTYADRDMQMVELPIPVPKEDEVLLRVKSVAICHTDVIIRGGKAPHALYPVVPGHELAGEIVSCGKAVRHLKPGMRGAVHAILPCGHCSVCRNGDPPACLNYNELGCVSNGGMEEYCVFPARFFYPIPDNISLDEATLLEPLSNAIKVMEKARLQFGEKIVVIGPGAIGVMVAMMANMYHPKTLVIVGTSRERLELVQELVHADHYINCNDDQQMRFLRETVLEGRGADAVLEVAGTASSMEMALDLVGASGRICIEGSVAADMATGVNLYDLQRNQNSMIGVSGWTTAIYRQAKELVENGIIDLKPLITARMPLSEWEKGFDLMTINRRKTFRVILNP